MRALAVLRYTKSAAASKARTMPRRFLTLCLFVLAAILPGLSGASAQSPQPPGWSILQGAGPLTVDYPASLVPVSAGPTERGEGRKFRSADGRVEFAAYSLANTDKDSPGAYLRKNLLVPPSKVSSTGG